MLEMISVLLPKPSGDVLTGIGDDCAVIRTENRKDLLQLLKTDAVIEGIHYPEKTPLEKVGWKALCRPLSDIAAMGGTPLHATVTVAAPSSWTNADWKALYRGIAKAARMHSLCVVGGETVRSPGPAFLSVALTGTVPEKNLKLRSGAHPGDLLCVTGRLGGSFRSGRHLNFHPRLEEGRWLGSERGVTAMMDLSDGIGSDLPKLAGKSGCSYRIAPEALPRHSGCSVTQALADGEDYELLLTVTPKRWPALMGAWSEHFPKTPLTCIGSMVGTDSVPTPLASGYDHLAR